MPPSLRTPLHSRTSSTAASLSGSPRGRRLSKSSMHDAVGLYRDIQGQHDALDLTVLSNEGSGGNGMGNLADELADAFSEYGEDDYYDNEFQTEDTETPCAQSKDIDHRVEHCPALRNAEDVDIAGGNDHHLDLLSPQRKGHQRNTSQYDDSDHGSDSDLDAAGIPPSLMLKIDAIDSLARRGAETYGGLADDVLNRVIISLRDLESQSSVEGSASRLITAHSALTTHLTHQTRQLHNLTFPLLSPFAATPDSDSIDVLLPLLISLLEDMPRPSMSAFNSLTALHSTTTELIQTLSYVSDTLHMSRQTTVTATRRLKTVKELVAEMRRDEELRDEGERWLARGNWGERLEKRECAGVCGEVIGGFEDFCNDWRERLLAQAESRA